MVFIPGVSNRRRRKKEEFWYCQKCGEPQPFTADGLRVLERKVLVLKICRKCGEEYIIRQLEAGARKDKKF